MASRGGIIENGKVADATKSRSWGEWSSEFAHDHPFVVEVGLGATAFAAVIASRGKLTSLAERLLPKASAALEGAAVKEGGSAAFANESHRLVPGVGLNLEIRPVTEALINDGLPITAANRAAALSPASIRGAAHYLGETGGPWKNGLGRNEPNVSWAQIAAGTSEPTVATVLKEGLPITAANSVGASEKLFDPKIAAASQEVLRSPAWMRERIIRGATHELNPAAPNVVSENTLSANSKLPSNLAAFDASDYRFVPVTNLLRDIRRDQGQVVRAVDGPSRLVFGKDNAIQHVLYNKDATEAERADLILRAGYAGLIHNDVLAAEAASKLQGQSIGFISRPIDRWASPSEMQALASEGSRAYVDGDIAAGNNYTAYLTERFGSFTPELRASGRDRTSPEFGWSESAKKALFDFKAALKAQGN